MRDLTNLAWPEAPYGAEQRPFGRPAQILTAVAVDWAQVGGGEMVPLAAATVYVRTHRAGCVDIAPDTLNVGFRVTVLDDLLTVTGQLGVIDRALIRARRHASVLAGHDLGEDLVAMSALTDRPLRGAFGVLEAWTDRATKGRGMARMIDTRRDLTSQERQTGAEQRVGASLDPPLGVVFPELAGDAGEVALATLTRCLAVAVTAGWHLNLYRWDGRFDARAAATIAGWDCFTRNDRNDTALTTD